MKVVKTKSWVVKHEEVVRHVGDYKVTDSYLDGKLIGQEWERIDGKVTHPDAYEPIHMHFLYYDDLSFLESDLCHGDDRFYEMLPDGGFVEDWDNFKGFKHVLCIYLSMDGNMYQIDQQEPLPLWRSFDYISGFDNLDCDLDEIQEFLSQFDCVRDVKKIEIPYYNQDEGRTHAVVFQYRAPSRKSFVSKLKEALPKKHKDLYLHGM